MDQLGFSPFEFSSFKVEDRNANYWQYTHTDGHPMTYSRSAYPVWYMDKLYTCNQSDCGKQISLEKTCYEDSPRDQLYSFSHLFTLSAHHREKQ